MPSSYTTGTTPSSARGPGSRPIEIEGLEDEDYELQAALQASMMGGDATYETYEAPPTPPPRLTRATAPLPAVDPESPVDTNSGAQTPTDELPPLISPAALVDPVTASLERNKRMLEQMKAQQEFAHRELWAEGAGGSDLAALQTRREERQRQEAEEAEQLRLAIEESEALARQEGHVALGREDEDEDDMDVDAVMPQLRPVSNPYPRPVIDRVYDDDDAELQAALKASLEHMPEGWELPKLPPHRSPAPPPETRAREENRQTTVDRDMEDVESVLSDETSTTADHPPSDAAAEAVSVDELRKRRLARFGA
jgi:ataxin-3